MEYKFQDLVNSEDIFSFGSALEDFICVVFVPDRNIVTQELHNNYALDDISVTDAEMIQSLSPRVTTTSVDDYTRYLNDPKDVHMSELLNAPSYTKATTMTVNLVLETIHETQDKSAEDVIATPLATPPTKIKRKKIKDTFQANLLNEVRNLSHKFLPKVVAEYIQPRLARTVRDELKKNPINPSKPSSTPAVTFTEYELKQKLYDMMQNTCSFLDHEKHLELYITLMNSMGVDENASKGNKSSQYKRSQDCQDPHANREREKRRKRRRKDVGGSSSKKSIDQEDSSYFERGDDAKEPTQNEETEQDVQTKEVPGKKNPIVKKIFKKEKITKEDVEGLAFELLKGTSKNSKTGLKSRHEVYSKLNIRSVQSIKVNKQYGYAYLEEIVVTRTDDKEYKFAEADFPNLNQNDIEDLYILKIQNKIRNIKGVEEYDLINAIKMYIRRIVIKKRVEDIQMGVESCNNLHF
ncbi:hypothetical protein Tco_0468727 [Tanacetum coccineum]